MKKWLQRIRGAVGTAVTWAVAWSGVGAIISLLGGGSSFGLAFDAAIFAATGLVAGATFSVVLGVAEGRRRFDQMSLPRFAACGAAAGLLLSGVMLTISVAAGGEITLANYMLTGSVFALFGAGSAAGSLALARKADDRDLLESGEEALGLIEAESAQ